MKKSMILLGMLSIGYANAQEGNVGINTEEPKATLEIVPNATNLAGTTNEGLLIPRLSKARVAAIAAGNLVEGTKVYVTDEVTAADTQFIGTGKGFYFYNGTKWVKQLASDKEELWKVDNSGGFNSVYLDNKIGGIVLRGDATSHPNPNNPSGIAGVSLFSHSDVPQFAGGFGLVRGRGTLENPLPIKQGDNMITLGSGGYDSTKYAWNSSAIFSYAMKDWTADEHSSNLEFHTTNKLTRRVAMIIGSTGNVGIGTIHKAEPLDKLHIRGGNVRIENLKGAGDRAVYADENGVLKTGGSIASNNGVQNETGMTCTAANAGKINYTTIQKDGKDVGVFGFCMQKGTDYVWAYMLGGSNIYGTSVNGAAFGQGL